MLGKISGLVGRHGRVGPRRSMTDTSKTLRAGRDLRLEHWRHLVTEPQIGGANDTRRHPRLTILATRAHRRDSLDKLRLANHFERVRSVGTIHGCALDKDRLPHVVRRCVCYEILEQIAVARSIPEVMVRVNDRKVGLDRRFVGQRQPVLRAEPSMGGPLRQRLGGQEAVRGARARETTQRICPCPFKKFPARDVAHVWLPAHW